MDKPISPEAKPQVEQPPVQPGVEAEPKPETERMPEAGAEQADKAEPSKAAETPTAAVPTPAKEVAPENANRDPVLIQVERELEDGLMEAYQQMPANLRTKFKAEGERVAQTIRQGFATGKIKARQIISLITGWLKMIPGINKWFLRQQAKIKTDALMRIHEENKDK